MSDNRKALIGTIVFVGFIGILFHFYNQEKESLRKNGKTTIVTLTNTKGDRMDCYYQVEGKDYSAIKNVRDQYLQDGEKYNLFYDPEDPGAHCEIDYTNPVIEENSFSDTETVSIDQPIKLNKEVRFTYIVDGVQYTRFQEPPETIDVNFTKTYRVKYNKENPSIGYLVFE